MAKFTGKRFYFLFFLSLLLVAEDSEAQDTLIRTLSEVTISATKTEKKLLDAGRSVSIISKDEIKRGNYNSLAEILSQEAGIYITGTGQTPGSNQSIFLQGANSNQTAIFIDGIRITDASTVNNTVDLSEISIANIERIEILRGSHSTLFGSSAIGGVINITTGIPEKEGLKINTSVATGTFGHGTFSINPQITSGYKFKNGIYVNGTIDYNQVDGLDATVDTVSTQGIYKNRDKDDWEKFSSGISLGYSKNKTDARVNYYYTNSETDIDKSAYTDDDNYVLNFKRSVMSLQLKRKLSTRMNLSLSGGASWNERKALNDSSIISVANDYDHQYTRDIYKGFTSNVDLLFTYNQRKWNFIAGLARSDEEMRSENYYYSAYYFDPYPPLIFEGLNELKQPRPSSSINSLYSQLDLKGELLSNKLSHFNLVGGIRYDNHSIFKDLISFEINPGYKLSKSILLYFSYSTGYNAPSLYELYTTSKYIPWDGSAESGISIGNKLLNPEKSKSAELGIKYQFNSTGFLSIAAFSRNTKNNIEYVYLWDATIPIERLGSDPFRDDYRGDTYINVGNNKVYGIQVNAQLLLLKDLHLKTGISLTQGSLTYISSSEIQKQTAGTHVQLFNNGKFLDQSNQEQKGLIRRPNTAMAELSYRGIKNASINVLGKFIDKRADVYYDTQIKPQGALNTISVSKYFLTDLSAAYNFGSHVLISARIENCFNVDYSEIRGFSTRGRGYYFKIAYTY